MLTITLLVVLALSLAGNALHLPDVRARLGFGPPCPTTTTTDSTGTTAAGPAPAAGDYIDPCNPWATR